MSALIESLLFYGLGIILGIFKPKQQHKKLHKILTYFPKIFWLYVIIVIIIEGLVPIPFGPRNLYESFFINGFACMSFYIGYFVSKLLQKRKKAD